MVRRFLALGACVVCALAASLPTAVLFAPALGQDESATAVASRVAPDQGAVSPVTPFEAGSLSDELDPWLGWNQGAELLDELVGSPAVDEAALTRRATRALESRLASWPGGLVLGSGGELVTVFGFAPERARDLLVPVTQQRGLAADYRPPDLVLVPGVRAGVQVRAAMLPDLEELLSAALQVGVPLAGVSGYRSYGTQAALFERRVQERLAQSGWTISVEEARQRANRGTALPGHSQHQLGLALDFSTAGLGYQVTPAFGGTAASQWLRAHAWEYGFVFPYTADGQERTGYIPEPWHLRWVGKPLAAFMMAEAYLDSGDVVADDYLEALESLLAELAATGTVRQGE